MKTILTVLSIALAMNAQASTYQGSTFEQVWKQKLVKDWNHHFY